MSLLENVTKNFSAQETSVLKSSAQRAAKLFQLWLCKVMEVHASKKDDPASRIHFCCRFLQSVRDREVDPSSFKWPGFHYMERWIHVIADIGVQNNQDLFKNSLFMMKKLIFGVQ